MLVSDDIVLALLNRVYYQQAVEKLLHYNLKLNLRQLYFKTFIEFQHFLAAHVYIKIKHFNHV